MSIRSLEKEKDYMKRILWLVFVIFLVERSEAQGLSSIPVDTLFSALDKVETASVIGSNQLPAYEVDACLANLLDDLVNSDKKCSGNIGYYFSIKDTGLVSVSPVDLGRLRSDKFYGYFVFRGRIFLCYGYSNSLLSKKATGALLTLKSYVSGLKLDDLYLGGDTDGKLKVFYCNGDKRYALIKTCQRPGKSEGK